MGVVYYANYLTWFEVARTDLLRELGRSYREVEAQDVFLPVVEAHCYYKNPARYDDVIVIHTEASQPTRATVRFDYRCERDDDGTVLATGSTSHVAVNGKGRPIRLPPTLKDLLS
jgi:acyl-CoA thioester hydrolase